MLVAHIQHSSLADDELEADLSSASQQCQSMNVAGMSLSWGRVNHGVI